MRAFCALFLALLLSCLILTSCGSGEGSSQSGIAETPRITMLTVRDEAHVVANPGDAFVLNSAGTLLSVIRVQRRNPVITYAEGVDYRVDLPNKIIEILTGGQIIPDTQLYIDYTVETIL